MIPPDRSTEGRLSQCFHCFTPFIPYQGGTALGCYEDNSDKYVLRIFDFVVAEQVLGITL